MFCTNCGKELPKNTVFCVHCGAKMRKSEPKEESKAAEEGDIGAEELQEEEEYLDIDEEGFERDPSNEEVEETSPEIIEEETPLATVMQKSSHIEEPEEPAEPKEMEKVEKVEGPEEPEEREEIEEAEQVRTKKSYKKVLLVSTAFLMLLAFAGGFLYLSHLFSPASAVASFTEAVENEDYDLILDHTDTQEMSIDEENVEELVYYLQSDDALSTFEAEMEDHLKNGDDNFTHEWPVAIEKTGTKYLLFSEYGYRFEPYEITVPNTYEGMVFRINEMEETAEADGGSVTFSNLAIGNYPLEVSYDGEHGEVQESVTISLTEASDRSWTYIPQFEDAYITIEASEDNSELIVNGVRQGVLLNSPYELGPVALNGTTEIQAVKTVNGREEYSEPVVIEEDTNDYMLVFDIEEAEDKVAEELAELEAAREEAEERAEQEEQERIEEEEERIALLEEMEEENSENSEMEEMYEEDFLEEELDYLEELLLHDIDYIVEDLHLVIHYHAADWVEAYTYKDSSYFYHIHSSFENEYLNRIETNFEDQMEEGWSFQGELVSTAADAASFEIEESGDSFTASLEVQMNFYSSYYEDGEEPSTFPKSDNSSQWRYFFIFDRGEWWISDQEELNQWDPDDEVFLY